MNQRNPKYANIRRWILVTIIASGIILMVFSAVIGKYFAQTDNSIWFENILLNLSTELIGAGITFSLIKILLGERKELDDIIEMDKLNVQSEKTYNTLTKLSNNLSSVLKQAGIDDLEVLTSTSPNIRISSQESDEINRIATVMENLITQIRRLNSESELPADAILNLAKAFMGQMKWTQAAQLLDEYTRLYPNDWEAQISRGIAHMNSRQDRASIISAIRAYNEAIATLPDDIDENYLARIHTYRAAAFKRIGKLEEMEADLEFASKRVSRSREVDDLNYNFACLYALRGERTLLFDKIRKIQTRKYIFAIRNHMDDYFKNFAYDDDFLQLLDKLRLELPNL